MSTILGPSKSYIDLLDEATTSKLQKAEDTGSAYQKTPIRPSAAGNCTRELFYQLMEYHGKAKYPKELKEPSVDRLLNLGHSIEWHLIRQFEAISDVFQIRYKQQVLDFGYLETSDPAMSQHLEGSLDLVFWSEKHRCVADVKSKGGGWDFKARKSRWDSSTDKYAAMETVERIGDNSFWVPNLDDFIEELGDPFFAANFMQLNLYANNDFLRERGIDHGAIIQYHKADSQLREVRFKPSRRLYKRTIAKFQTALDAAAAGDVEKAPRDHEKGSFKCRYCAFAKECWKK